ncbi:hypothetical protein D7Z54_14245 [Salibacterium salarium]|uniref:LiaI-LiaF-like transmembrane region domain-containing protein n=1 Tax=Salibacterium salarium TaxID=284579 RepID=A0A3R9Q362_9BACI|nr:DUF5668 domain-containing protein [Salibacterium salarium]RSL32609.1 hypothetical protein D7Z54_14245 [Salibacterium salarium]
MKKQSLFYGIILIGIGLLFLLQNWEITVAARWFDWPTLLLITGFAFMAESIFKRVPLSFLPGLLLLIFGLHFHFLEWFANWPNHISIYAVFIGSAILLDYIQTRRSGWFTGLLLLLIGAAFFYSNELRGIIGESIFSPMYRFGPLLLIILGIYFTLRNKT